MSYWTSLKKSGINIYCQYGVENFSSNLYMYDIQMMVENENAIIKVDMSKNIKKQSKSSNTCLDMSDIIKDDFKSLKLIQFWDKYVIKGMKNKLEANKLKSKEWALIIMVDEKEWKFKMTPEFEKRNELYDMRFIITEMQ